MSVCPEYNLSKVVLLILSIITLVIVSFCIDTYRDYYEDGSKTNKNKWLKYQLTLFFCNCIIVYSFYRIKTGKENLQQPYDFPDGFKFSSLFAIMNLISVISGGTRKKNGALIFYLFSSMSIILSCILGYKYIKEFIDTNPNASEGLRTGIVKDFTRVSNLVKVPYQYYKKRKEDSTEGGKGIQAVTTQASGPPVYNKKRKKGSTDGEKGIQMTTLRRKSPAVTTQASGIPVSETLTPQVKPQTRKQTNPKLIEQIKKVKGDGLHGLGILKGGTVQKQYSGKVQEQFQDIRAKYKGTGKGSLQDFNYKKFQGKVGNPLGVK